MRFFFTLALLLVYLTSGIAQEDRLWIVDPQRNWQTRPGNIDVASITLKPHGVYTEVGLYLTFSAREGDFQAGTQLEINYSFNLPEEAMVTDSWLWIEDVIIKAKMLDRWTASQIYESIVNRRQDPSILVKNGQGNYKLNIFPMLAGSSRRVKITYLVPAQWHPDKVITSIPMTLFNTSETRLENIQIRSWLDPEWGTPQVEGYFNSIFQAVSHPNLGSFWEINLDPDHLNNNPINVSTAAPLKDGLFVGKLDKGNTNENYYQMVLFPNQVVEFENLEPKRIMVLLDYHPENSSTPQWALLQRLKNELKRNLGPDDFFNLILTDLVIDPISDVWIPADQTSIDNVFESLPDNPIAQYSVLANLLGEGIDFVQQSGKSGEIVLISNDGQMDDLTEANALIDDVMNLRGDTDIPIHILNYQNRSVAVDWINGQQYYGNDYLFQILSQQTNGEYFNQFECCSFAGNMSRIFQSVGAVRGQLDIYTSLDSGFCYSRFTLGRERQFVSLNQPYIQIGKYAGSFPFQIEMAGELEGLLFDESLQVGANDLIASDTLLEEVWAGQFIRSLEGEASTNTTINEIIYHSIEDRVLSLYTALIALEPNLGGEPCTDCTDESNDGEGTTVSSEEKWVNDLVKMEAFPNPFREKVNIRVQFPEKINPDDCHFAIFNPLGQLVKTYQVQSYTGNNEFNFTWDAKSDEGLQLAAGIYLFIAETPYGTAHLKLHYLP